MNKNKYLGIWFLVYLNQARLSSKYLKKKLRIAF